MMQDYKPLWGTACHRAAASVALGGRIKEEDPWDLNLITGVKRKMMQDYKPLWGTACHRAAASVALGGRIKEEDPWDLNLITGEKREQNYVNKGLCGFMPSLVTKTLNTPSALFAV